MEEDALTGVVTRLRRRLSVESDEPKSPATPTKKKGGRLAAKPNLENIDELTTVINPRRRGKLVAKDVEKVEETPLTPSRRSTRARSTSITSDILQNCDSPRARRASRRNSQTGSDNEVPVTPVVKTRRTRKGSTSSIESQGEPVSAKEYKVITDNVIVEESNSQEIDESSKGLAANINSSSEIRRSPRLSAKKSNQDISTDHVLNENVKLLMDKEKDREQELKTSTNSSSTSSKTMVQNGDKKSIKNTSTPNDLLSQQFPPVRVIVTKMTDKPKMKTKKNKNISTSFSGESKSANRSRSKSLSSLSKSASDAEHIFFSDNEKHRKIMFKKNNDVLDNLNLVFSGTTKNVKEIAAKKENNVSQSTTIFTDTHEPGIDKNESGDNPYKSENSLDKRFVSQKIKSSINLEDLNSNTDSIDKITKISSRSNIIEGGDQCVPVIDQHLNNEDKTIINLNNISEIHPTADRNMSHCNDEHQTTNLNNSCEPMDIDETLPQDITTNDYEDEIIVPKQKSVDCAKNEIVDVTPSKKNNFFSESSFHELSHLKTDEHSNKENRLMLYSEIKVDMSNSQINVDKHIPAIRKSNVNIQSKSLDVPGGNDTNDVKRQDNNLPPATPLMQCKASKSVMKTSTPANVFNVAEKDKQGEALSSNLNSSSISETSSEKSLLPDISHNENNLLDDEAEDAGTDYQSGDSQDEEERRHADENEIYEKGETLTSDDEMSNDSDYEKDSFVVSSDEQDKELLSGSGDDLASSDDELTMAAKSKTKYNQRKIKEQKLASREMFKARHNIESNLQNKSGIDKSKNKLKVFNHSNSTERSSSEEPKIQPMTRNRRRLDSSMAKSSDENSSVNKEKNKENCTESSLDISCSQFDENEINMTYFEAKTTEKDPLSNSLFIKEEIKTPVKDSNVSIIDVSCGDHIEEVNINENKYISKSTSTTKSLIQTVVDSDTSSSENEDLMQNFDKMLDNLKEMHYKKKNSSSNFELKQKQMSEKSVIDNLNLNLKKPPAQIVIHKQSKSLKNETVSEVKSTNTKVNQINDDSSDAIDLKLLFPDSDSDSAPEEKKIDYVTDDFIPLKTTESKTNIYNNKDGTEEYLPSKEPTEKHKGKKKKHCSTVNIEDVPVYFENSDVLCEEHIPETEDYDADKHQACGLAEENDSQNTTEKRRKKKKKRHSKDVNFTVMNANENVLSIHNDISVMRNISLDEKSDKFYEMPSNTPMNLNGASEENVLSKESTEKHRKKKKNRKYNDTGNIQDVAVNFDKATDLDEKDISETIDYSVDKHQECDQSEDISVETAKKRKKKKNKKKHYSPDVSDTVTEIEQNLSNVIQEMPQPSNVTVDKKSKRHKRKLSNTMETLTGEHDIGTQMHLRDEPDLSAGSERKKRKLSNRSKSDAHENKSGKDNINGQQFTEKSMALTKAKENILKKKNKKPSQDPDLNKMPSSKDDDNNKFNTNKESTRNALKDVSTGDKKKKQWKTQNTVTDHVVNPVKENKKRKFRDDDELHKIKSAKNQGSALGHLPIPRLPATVLEQLEAKPKHKRVKIEARHTVLSTTQFQVEETKPNRIKPSKYLEESIHIDSRSPEPKKKKLKLRNIAPSVSSSACGFTTSFKVNVIPRETNFIAQSINASNFKEDHLYNKNIRRQGTYELYKKQRRIKLSKF